MTGWIDRISIRYRGGPIAGVAALAAALCAAVLPAWAQTYPSRPVHLVVPYAAGGTGDIIGRLIADKLAQSLGQTFVIDNRAGASGAIGTQSVVAAMPDGQTLLVGQTGEIAINQHWIKDPTYDPEKDLQPIALAAVVPLALVVPRNAPYSTVAGMLAAAKARRLSFASAGTGTPGHFAGELLKLRSAGQFTHVPYKGAGPALNDLVGGHVDLFFSGFPAAAPQVKAGTLKLLAVSSGKRATAAPDAPAVAETAGIGDFDITLWVGFFAPRATPKPVVARLNAEINKVLALPDIRARLLEDGAEIRPMAPDEVTAFARGESQKYLRIIQETGVTSD
jgi:tripartite-type tricarboxylate transporter receptor subunit TctC